MATTAVAEATVIATAAAAGDAATFAAWQGFADGKAIGVGFIVAAIAVLAVDEARSRRSFTPGWAAWIGIIGAVVAIVAFVMGMILGIEIAAPIWLVTTITAGLWILWFGVGLMRSESGAVTFEEPDTRRSRVA